MGSSTHKYADVVLSADELANVPADQSGYATTMSHRTLQKISSSGSAAFSLDGRSQDRQCCECGTHAPRHGIGGLPRSFVGKNVSPSVLAQHEEHQDKDPSQEVNADSTDTLVLVVSLNNAHEAQGDRSTLPVRRLRVQMTSKKRLGISLD
jgi:hypothetical protein